MAGGYKVFDYSYSSPSVTASASQDLSSAVSGIETLVSNLRDFKEKAGVAKTEFEGLAKSLEGIKNVVSGNIYISPDFKNLFVELNKQLPKLEGDVVGKIVNIREYANQLSTAFESFNLTDEKVNLMAKVTKSFTAFAVVMGELRNYKEVLDNPDLAKGVPKVVESYQEMVKGLAGSLEVQNGIDTFSQVVVRLRNFIEAVREANTAEFANAANNLRAFYPLADALKEINQNIILVNGIEASLFENAKKGEDERKTVPSLFASYSTLVERINNSVPKEETLSKFSKIANSLHNFSIGLDKIVDVQRRLFSTNNHVNLLSPYKNSDNAAKVTAFVENLNSFVTQINSTDLDEVNTERFTKLSKVLSSVSSISMSIDNLAFANNKKFTVLNSVDGANEAVEKIVTYLINFVKKFNKDFDDLVNALVFIDSSPDSTVSSVREKIDKNIDKVKEISSILHSVLSSINTSKTLVAPLTKENINSYASNISDFIKNFIISINSMWNAIGTEIKSTASDTDKIKQVKDDFENISGVVNVLEKIAKSFSSVFKADSSSTFENIKAKINEIPNVLKAFIDAFSADFVSQLKNSEDLVSRIKSLSNVIETIASGFKGVLDVSGKLEEVKTAFPNVIGTLIGFVNEIKNSWSKSSYGSLDEKKLIEKYTPIINFTKKIADLIESMVSGFKGIKVAASLNKDKSIETALSDSNSIILTYVNGLKNFWNKDVSGVGDSGDKIEEYKPLIESTKNIASIISLLSNGLAGIKDIATNKKEITGPLDNAREAVEEFTTKLKDFWQVGSAKGNAYSKPEDFDENLKRVTKVVSIVNIMANSLTSLSNLKSFDAEETIKPISTFLTQVAGLVKDKTFKEEEFQKALDKLNTFSRALKQIASFINSSLKMSSANFKFNIDGIVGKIKDFIEKMATLANLSSFTDFERVADAVSKFKTKMYDATEQVKKSSLEWTKFKAVMRQIYTAFVGGAVIYSIVRGIKSAIKEMFNLEYAMARVNTIARVSESTLKDMTHRVQEMSSKYGMASADVSKALYDINSATIKGEASVKILEQSMALAVAGFTDVAKVSDLIAKAVNAYQYNVAEASKISDILFVTVERGINPMEELSEYMGRLFTVSANAGVSLEEVGAGLATLTARGYQTNVASTALNSAILKLSTGTKELNKLFQRYGYASSSSALRTIGLGGALEVLNKATGGATEKLHDLGFNYRDIRAATTLASSAIDEYNKTLTMMTDKNYTANKTAEALAKVQDTVKFKFDKLKSTFTVFIQTISEYLNKNALIKTTLQGLINVLNDIIDSMRGAHLTLKDQFLASLVTFFPKLVATYGIIKLFTPAYLKLKDVFVIVTAAIHKQVDAVTKLKTALESVGKAAAYYAIVQGVGKTAGWIEQINEAGTWKPGSNTANGLSWGEALQASFASIVGSFGNAIDYVFGTDLGERIYDALKPDAIEYVDWDAIAKSRAHGGEYNKSLFASKMGTDIIPMLRDWNPLFEGLDESFITEVYNKLSEQLQAEAKLRKISAEDLKAAQDQLNAWRDKAFSLNDEISKLLPNVKAMRDVFEEASKSIADASEKYAGEFEKAIGKFAGVDDAINTLVSGTGLSVEQIQSGMSSVGNLDVLKKILRKQDIIEARDIEDAIEPFIGDFITSIDGYKNRLREALSDVYVNPETTKDWYEIVGKYRALSGNYGEMGWDDLFNGMQKYPELVKFIENISSEAKDAFDTFMDFQKYPEDMLKNPVEQIISYLSTVGVINDEQKAKLEKEKEDIISRWLRLPDNYKNDPNYVANLIADTLSDPKIREAVSYLSQNFSEVAKGMNKLRKELVDFGNAIQELNSQKISISDIVNNTFNLTSVSELKNMLKVKLYDPETLATLGSDKINEAISKYLSTALIGLRKKLSRDEILKEVEQQMLQDNAHLKTLSPEERKKIIGSILDAGKGIVDFYSDFAKQLSELDFKKFINKLKFGGDISVYQQYKEDSLRIEEIMDSYVSGVGSFREALKKVNEVGFKEAQILFQDSGWSDFVILYEKLNKIWSDSASKIQTEYKNFNKKAESFIDKYRDSLLTPIQKFAKVDDELNLQLKMLEIQSEQGNVSPELLNNTLQNIEELQKLNEEVMSMKVPSSITASEAVKTGSREAFDLVATNIFRDMYKVNVQQSNYQKDLLSNVEQLVKKSNSGLEIVAHGR